MEVKPLNRNKTVTTRVLTGNRTVGERNPSWNGGVEVGIPSGERSGGKSSERGRQSGGRVLNGDRGMREES